MKTPNSKAIKSMVTENNSHNANNNQHKGMKSEEFSKENSSSFYEDNTPSHSSATQQNPNLRKNASVKSNQDGYQISNFENHDSFLKYNNNSHQTTSKYGAQVSTHLYKIIRGRGYNLI